MRECIVNLEENNDSSEIWQVYTEGKETTRIKNNLTYMTDDEKFETILTAAKILSNCPNPNSTGGKKTGLAIGKIQSGKTSNFISLMALAFDNNYNIIVVFGGTKNNLLSQTEMRIREMFDIDNNNREDRDVIVLNTANKFDSISPDHLARMYAKGKKIIIVALKHQMHINSVKSFIIEANLDKKPILLIDDEGDQASLNAKVALKQRTVIYDNLLQLRESLNHVCFISITATPQANLLINTIDSLSPDFCELVEPGKDYIGGAMFHGENQNYYVIEIPDENIDMLEESGVPDSFFNSLGVFFVGSIIRKFRKEGKNHVMLIHPSQKKFEHKEVEKKVELILYRWLMASECPTESTYIELEKYLRNGYEELSRTVSDMPDFKLIMDNINEELNDCRTLVINSDKNTNIDYYKTRNIIIIGGNMVERGLTINDLAVTYIVRRSKSKSNADVVEQRARWFGYRKKYFDLCRVYCSAQIKKDFSNLLSHEDDIWEWIKYCKDNNVNIKEMPRLFELDNNLNPTRKSVAPKLDDVKFGVWTEQKKINIDKGYLLNLNKIWDDFLSKYEYEDIKFANQEHRKYINVPLEEINKIIAKYYSNKVSSFNDKYPKAVALRKGKKEEIPFVTVVKMRFATGEKRNFDSEYTITSNLMQGHSQNRDKNDPLYYLGDRYIFLNETQLQIHLVHPEIDNVLLGDLTVPMLAFYSPAVNKERVVGWLE